MTYDKFIVTVSERTGPKNHVPIETFEYDNISDAREKFLTLQIDVSDKAISLAAIDGQWRQQLASASIGFLSAAWLPESAPATERELADAMLEEARNA